MPYLKYVAYMRLRTVEIVGFKSFRDHVEVEIGDGMTCIVGPNGCGKSNVVDAIKWAMGDMSPKSLRGSSMSDVIFAGTEKIKPAGMAEVTLTFENTAVTRADEEGTQTELDEIMSEEVGEEAMPSGEPGDGDWEFGDSIPREFRNLAEIAITRRLHRSGESEYLINKASCRLRDIRMLLAGTGLGKQGYSIIEQGQIGFIVNARPSERRLIIEEASGITRYKDQRKRAERKLKRTEQNLQRIRDILDEIEDRLQSLEVQAERAREHKRISGELRSLEIALLLDRRSAAAKKSEKLKRQLKVAKKEVEKGQISLKKSEKSLKKARTAAEDADKRHADVTENFYKVETRLNLARSNRDHALDARRQASERRENLIKDRIRQQQRRTDVAEELKRVRRKLENVDEKPEEAVAAVGDLEEVLQELRERRRQATSQRDAARAELANQRGEIKRIEERIQWIDGQLGELDEREQAARQEREGVVEERDDLQRSISRIRIDHDRTREEIEKRRAEVDKEETKLADLREDLEAAVRREEELVRKRLKLQASIDSLEELRRQGEGYADGVRRVLEWARDEERDDILGPLGDFLDVPGGDESAYAAFFGDRLGDIVVRDRQAALDALKLLVDEEGGRVGCFPLPQGVDEPEELAGPWLERLEIIDELADAPDSVRNEQGEGPEAWATRDGEVVFADGRVVGGGTAESGETALRQARQLEELREELGQVVDAHGEADEVLELAREEVVAGQAMLEEAREKLQSTIHKARGLKQELDGEEREEERARVRVERLASQIDEVAKTGHRLQEERETLADRSDEIVDAMPDREEALAAAEGEVEALDEQIDEVSEELTRHKVKVAKAGERRRHLEESAQRSQDEIKRASEQIERFATEIEEQEVRAKEAQMRAETLAGEVERLASDHKELGAEVEEAKQNVKTLGEKVKSLELVVLANRQDLGEAQESVQEFEMAYREAQLQIEHVTEQLAERFELELPEARREAMGCDVPAEKREELADKLKRRLRRIGEVNALAIEEFEETRERHAFQIEQRADLEESIADLREAIERMDWESRKRFRETFDAVTEKFETVFPRLFQGGQARLVLTEPEDLLTTGVDIEVQPPGKKLQNVNLLSGGEKALTAVSLIFSIFLLKPSPFAVLDEVDAPLDDANVGRFADMVQELSEISQMLVITHNRRTMEAPEKLYGVTMQEAGISKVVSVTLSELDDRLAS